MITYKSGNECVAVNKDTIRKVKVEDLTEVYEALKERIKISREDFINGNSDEINKIKVNAVNLYVAGLNLLFNDVDYRRRKFDENLRKRFGLFKINNRAKSALYVAERIEELELITPTRAINFNDLKTYCLKDYNTVKKEFDLYKKRLNAKLKIANGQDYDKYLKGLVDCSKEEYANQSTDYTRRMKKGLDASKDACRLIVSCLNNKESEIREKVISEFGEVHDEDRAIRRLFQYFKEVNKLNGMGYERISATNYNDLVAYALSKDKFRELVRIDDIKTQRQIPEVYKDIRRNPKFNDRFGSMIGNYDSMSVDLMTEIYHNLQEVNDMNNYKGLNIDPAKYMYLSKEEKDKMRAKVLFQMRVKFEHMSDQELEEFLTQKTNLFLLDEEDRKDYLSRARNIIINSIDISAEVINNEELLYHVEFLLGRRTPTAVFEYINNAQVSRFMYRKMYNTDLDLKDLNNLLYTQRIAAGYTLHKENQKAQALREQMAAQDRAFTSMIEEEMLQNARDTMRRYNNMMFRERLHQIREDAYKYLCEKYPDRSKQDLFRELSDYLGEFVRDREHDYKIFDELTPEKIDDLMNGKSNDIGFMFDVVKPEEDSQGSAKK